MVTHTRNSCSTYTHQSVHTHSSEHTHREHTHREHTPGAVGSHLYCGTREQLGVRCLAQGHLVVVLRVKSAVHSLPPPTIPAVPRLKLTTFGLRVRLSNIRPRLPHNDVILAISFS